MAIISKKRLNIENPDGLVAPIPEGHLRCFVSVRQGRGSIDKYEAFEILKTRPIPTKILETVQYRGRNTRYHVFSYPDPKA